MVSENVALGCTIEAIIDGRVLHGVLLSKSHYSIQTADPSFSTRQVWVIVLFFFKKKILDVNVMKKKSQESIKIVNASNLKIFGKCLQKQPYDKKIFSSSEAIDAYPP
ncbi:hypothetical protein YC2023_054500 [Brassica napus]